MNLLQCILTANDCYKKNKTIAPKGVMVHSTGANNKTLKRYVQPLESDPNYNDLMSKLGTNTNNNDWNMSGTSACVHGFIGALADGSIATVQTLPWNWRGWHCASGSKGSGNDTHISFEICEDGLSDATYFNKVYQEAVELVAMLCKEYNLDPMADGVVICHSEGYSRGIASNHADVMHWFPKFGKSMDTFRADVKVLISKEEDKEDDVVIGETYVVQSGDSWWGIATKVFGEGQGARYTELQALNPDITTLHPRDVIVIKVGESEETKQPLESASDWAQEAWIKAYNKDILDGTNPQGVVTREMLAVILDALGLLD